tara:strand:+ start:566 stop:736 length:171 start_codon:yes stop_codon:yes gene_type:complete
MRLKYIGKDGNLKIGGRGLKHGEIVEGSEALSKRGDFEEIKTTVDETKEQIESEKE